MGSGTDRRYDLNDLPGITPRSGSGAMRGIVMMLAASLLVTANEALVKLALGAAGSRRGAILPGAVRAVGPAYLCRNQRIVWLSADTVLAAVSRTGRVGGTGT